MISASVFEREKQNNGRVAHCYFDPEIGTWLAYGKSAYALRRMVKTAGYDNLRSYSYDFDIACSMVGNLTFGQICESSTTLERSEEYVCIESRLEFDSEAYDSWVDRLKAERDNKKNMWVDTRISSKTPKGRFINDGMSPLSRHLRRGQIWRWPLWVFCSSGQYSSSPTFS